MNLNAFVFRVMNAVKGLRSNRAQRGLPLVGRTRAELETTVETSSHFKDGFDGMPSGERSHVPQTEKEVVDSEIDWELITQVNVLSRNGVEQVDKKPLPNVGDCVQINKADSEYHGIVGRVQIVREYDLPVLAFVRFDDDTGRYFNVKYLIPRHTMACQEL